MCYPATREYKAHRCRLADMPIRSMRDVRYLHAAGGGHFFDADTMRFFNSRILSGVRIGADGTVYFVTSERQSGTYGSYPHPSYSYPRRYTVRRATRRDFEYIDRMAPGTPTLDHTIHGADIDTVGEFQGYDTARQAWRAIDALLAAEAATPVCAECGAPVVSNPSAAHGGALPVAAYLHVNDADDARADHEARPPA